MPTTDPSVEFRQNFLRMIVQTLDTPEHEDLSELEGLDVLRDLRFDQEGLVDAAQAFSIEYDSSLYVEPIFQLGLPRQIPMIIRFFRLEGLFWPDGCGKTLGALVDEIYAASSCAAPAG